MIQIEGVTELSRAKNKSVHFDHQSEQMSDISRNSRKYADDLEKAAENTKKNTKEIKEKALAASELAKNSIELQRSITEQLKNKIVPDFPKEKENLEALKKLTASSLEKANAVYDESLTLFANINGMQIPEFDLSPNKKDASQLLQRAQNISVDLDEVLNSNNNLLNDLEENIELSNILIKR